MKKPDQTTLRWQSDSLFNRGCVQRGPGGFTLVELLVVIGIIALLIGILLPTLGKVRDSARNTKCASQLHQLVAATLMYRNEHKRFPTPGALPAFGGNVPCAIQKSLFDALAPYASWTRDIDPATPIDDLPKVTVCPWRAQVDTLKDPYPPDVFGAAWWNTGYSYFAGVADAGQPGVALQPKLVCDIKGKRTAVLWTDNLLSVQIGAGTAPTWAYFHFRGAQVIDPTVATVTVPSSFKGQHRAWSDGSVEYRPKGTIDLAASSLDAVAIYKVTSTATNFTYWAY